MKKLAKNIAIVLSFGIYCLQIQAQENVESMTAFVNTTTEIQYDYNYVDQEITWITAMDDSDTSSLEIIYDEHGRLETMISTCATNNQHMFSLNFKYSNTTSLFDTVLFFDKDWIGTFTYHYNEQDEIEAIKKYVSIDGELTLKTAIWYQYVDGLLDNRKKRTYYSSTDLEDFGDNVDSYSYVNGQCNVISHYFESSHGHASTEFIYVNNELTTQINSNFDGSDVMANQDYYDVTYFNDKTYHEVSHPFLITTLLQNLGFTRYSNGIRYYDQFFQDKLVYFVDSEDGHIIDLLYDVALPVVPVEPIDETALIHPNPVKDYLHFTANFDADEVVIYSITGQLVCKMNYKDENINLINLQSGGYILTAYNDQGESAQVQFIKQ